MCIKESGRMGLRIRRDGVVAFLFAICIDTRGSALEWALHIRIFLGGSVSIVETVEGGRDVACCYRSLLDAWRGEDNLDLTEYLTDY